MAKRFDPKRIFKLLESQPGTGLTVRGVMRFLKLPGRDREVLDAMLRKMVDDGQLRLVKNRRFAVNASIEKVSGRLSVHRDGYGFVRLEEKVSKAKDVFIPARKLNSAMHGDRVVVEIVRVHSDGRREGRVVRVEERAHERIVGVYHDHGRHALVVPEDPRFGQPLKVVWGDHLNAQDGDLVVARIDTYGTRGQTPLAEIVERLGDPHDPQVEIVAQARRFGLHDTFPDGVLEEAERVAHEVSADEIEGRVDLRQVPFVTIDGEDAKDFDDAVFAERQESGEFTLRVAIADVAHYVKQESELDREAWSRGNSVYFPGFCIPMLPESLSNGICSLKPDSDRLALVAEMQFDSEGNRLDFKSYPAVIRSHGRLTYRGVQDVLDGQAKLPDDIQRALGVMRKLAGQLKQGRLQRGSLELEIPEAKVELDEKGLAVTIGRSVRLFSHQLIEELMLAANEAVADFLTGEEMSLLYRVHDPPDSESLEPLRRILRGLDDAEALPKKVTPAHLKNIVEKFNGTPLEGLISHVVLRCLQQARYDAVNSGHFGLASDCYCHFTSPIRRYPDLVVHRALRRQWQGEKSISEAWLVKTAEQSSRSERRAMEAERDLVALKGCQVMQRHVGEVFHGHVSSVASFGLFVELDEIFVEGMMPLESLQDDFYSYDERRVCLVGRHSGREIHLGETFKVQVSAVRPERREIDFVPEGYRQQPVERSAHRTKKDLQKRGRRSR